MPREIDTDWFRDRLREHDISGRKLAQQLGINASTFNRLLNGHRRWKTEWAIDFAEILKLPLPEVMRRIGLDMPKESKAGIPLTGVADETGAVAPRKAAERRLVDRPGAEIPANTAAVRVQAPGSAMDGWVAYYEPRQKVPPESVGRLAVVTLRNKGGNWLGVLKRGYAPGKWNVWRLDGGSVAEDVDVESASPVIWIQS